MLFAGVADILGQTNFVSIIIEVRYELTFSNSSAESLNHLEKLAVPNSINISECEDGRRLQLFYSKTFASRN